MKTCHVSDDRQAIAYRHDVRAFGTIEGRRDMSRLYKGGDRHNIGDCRRNIAIMPVYNQYPIGLMPDKE